MAVRRLNYTGRRRIRQVDARITLEEGDEPRFSADLQLAEYSFEDSARVFVEAYRQTTWMRFDFGTVGELRVPPDCRLSEFDTSDAVLFRVRVTSDADRHGVLLAEADRIRPRRPDTEEDNRVPLLPVKPDGDLGDEVFRVDFSDRPLLLVNSRLGDFRAVARNPVFASLTYPAAMREILTRIIRMDQHLDTEDAVDWRSRWLRFATMLPGVSELPPHHDDESVDDWIQEAVGAFCRQFHMMARFGQYWTEEGDS